MQSYFGFTLPDTLESYFMNYSDEGDARRAYEEQCPTWKPSDHRFGAGLVKTEYESAWDADKARLDFLDAEAGSGRGIPAGEGTVRERIDRVRGVPEQKKTILMTP